MKTRMLVSILILVLAVLIICEGYATDKKVSKKDYRFIAGTWINEEYNSYPHAAKLVMYRDGTWERYLQTSDTGIYDSGHYVIVEKWTDSEGNIWYKMHIWVGTIGEGKPSRYELDRISKSGKVWEFINLSGDYPTEMDESVFNYHIMYRQ